VCIYTVCGLLVWGGGRLVMWVVVGGGYLCDCVLIKITNMGLCMPVNVSFICRPFVDPSWSCHIYGILPMY
jgi:hypothetical protein